MSAAGTANGTLVQLYDCNGTGAQSWQPQSNGNLRNPSSGRCLDATGQSSADGTRLQILSENSGARIDAHLGLRRQRQPGLVPACLTNQHDLDMKSSPRRCGELFSFP
nr:RICIN domain-containing protein [Kribbella qitaiheensis]